MSARGSDQQLLEELDALLDGRPTEVDEELGPLVQAADELRSALLEIELDPQVADQHLAQVLDGSVATVVPLPTRRPDLGWRRRVVVAALAAALTVFPAAAASAASAGSLPGQPLYRVKLAVEHLRVASVAWSPTRELGVRIGIAQTRLVELDGLVRIGDTEQIPPAIHALDKAVAAADRACAEAMKDGTASQVMKVAATLGQVRKAAGATKAAIVAKLALLPPAAKQEIVVAIDQSSTLNITSLTTQPPPPPGGSGATNTTSNPTVSTPPPTVAPANPPVTATDPPQTTAPTTTEPPPTTTTSAPPTTAAGGGGGSGNGKGGNGKDPSDATAPPTT